MPRDPDDFTRGDRLDRSFFLGQARHVAPALLGTLSLDRSGDRPVGVLVRAIEPTHGRDRIYDRRGVDDPAELTSGAGRLTEALGVTGEYDGSALEETPLELSHTDVDPDVTVSVRVGVSAAEDWPLRFTVTDSDYLSAPVHTDELDEGAVEACYERLREASDSELPRVDEKIS